MNDSPPAESPPPPASRNIELKARCPDLPAARAAALALGAVPRDVMAQIDTYFAASAGRLKLREITRDGGASAELIAYARPDATAARASDYRVIPVADPAALKAALAGTVGVRGVVEKRREVLVWRNVRVHLDDVSGVGRFVEFEAVVGDGFDDATSGENLRQAARALGVESQDAVGGSYVDFIECGATRGGGNVAGDD